MSLWCGLGSGMKPEEATCMGLELAVPSLRLGHVVWGPQIRAGSHWVE